MTEECPTFMHVLCSLSRHTSIHALLRSISLAAESYCILIRRTVRGGNPSIAQIVMRTGMKAKMYRFKRRRYLEDVIRGTSIIDDDFIASQIMMKGEPWEC